MLLLFVKGRTQLTMIMTETRTEHTSRISSADSVAIFVKPYHPCNGTEDWELATPAQSLL